MIFFCAQLIEKKKWNQWLNIKLLLLLCNDIDNNNNNRPFLSDGLSKNTETQI